MELNVKLIKRTQRIYEHKLARYSLIFRRILRPVIEDQEARFMQRLPLITKPTYKNIMDIKQENHIIGLAMRPVYVTVMTEEAEELLGKYKMFIKAVSPRMLLSQKIFDYSSKYSLAMAGYINKTTSKKIKKLILQGFKDNLTYGQMAKKIKINVFKDLSQGYRAKMLARTEAHGMVETGSFEAAKASKIIKEKTWSAAFDARETHADANYQTVRLMDQYVVGGYLLNYPGDTSYGAGMEEIVNCRCSSLHSPVIHKDRITTSKELLTRYEKPFELPSRGHLRNMSDERQIEQIIMDAKARGEKLTWSQAATINDDIVEFTRGSYKVVREYQVGGIKEIKGIGKSGVKDIIKMSKDIDNYIKYAPKYNGNVVYRNLNLKYDTTGVLSKMKVGNVIDMRGTSFWTSSDDVSSLFGDVQFIIRNPKTGVSISHLSGFGAKGKEVLFSNGARFRILNIKEVMKEAVKYQEFRMFGIKALPKRKVLQIVLEEIIVTPKLKLIALPAKVQISLENILAKNKITGTTTEGYKRGINVSMKIEVKGGGKAIFKKQSAELPGIVERMGGNGTEAGRERAAYVLSKEMGIDNVPVTVLRKVDGNFGSVQSWVQDAKTTIFRDYSDYSAYMKINYTKEHAKMQIFDALIGNADRHRGNFLVGEKIIYYIDNGFSMPNSLSAQTISAVRFKTEVIAPQIKNAFRHFGKAEMSEIKTNLENVLKSKKLEEEMRVLGLGSEWMYILDRASIMIKLINAGL